MDIWMVMGNDKNISVKIEDALTILQMFIASHRMLIVNVSRKMDCRMKEKILSNDDAAYFIMMYCGAYDYAIMVKNMIFIRGKATALLIAEVV